MIQIMMQRVARTCTKLQMLAGHIVITNIVLDSDIGNQLLERVLNIGKAVAIVFKNAPRLPVEIVLKPLSETKHSL